jgi:hypothetical protein
MDQPDNNMPYVSPQSFSLDLTDDLLCAIDSLIVAINNNNKDEAAKREVDMFTALARIRANAEQRRLEARAQGPVKRLTPARADCVRHVLGLVERELAVPGSVPTLYEDTKKRYDSLMEQEELEAAQGTTW